MAVAVALGGIVGLAVALLLGSALAVGVAVFVELLVTVAVAVTPTLADGAAAVLVGVLAGSADTVALAIGVGELVGAGGVLVDVGKAVRVAATVTAIEGVVVWAFVGVASGTTIIPVTVRVGRAEATSIGGREPSDPPQPDSAMPASKLKMSAPHCALPFAKGGSSRPAARASIPGEGTISRAVGDSARTMGLQAQVFFGGFGGVPALRLEIHLGGMFVLWVRHWDSPSTLV
ncbi:MAG TPA: hypothetical protein VMT89_09280 [Candidatus Acidoferrales bacterium]|nr:hypothetical protein [Candidatus Acidoferrales bacterium]